MAVSWRISVFQKMTCWNPYFYSVFWVRAFLAKLSKKGKFWTPTKNKRNIWLITEKLIFWYFCVFYCFSLVLFFVLFLCLFFGGFKGQVRWPEGPPYLALNPPYLHFFIFVLLFVFFGGFKGQVRWPKGPPHLALNPPYFFCVLFFCFFFPFLSLLLIEKPVFPPRKGHFLFSFECLPFVSP